MKFVESFKAGDSPVSRIAVGASVRIGRNVAFWLSNSVSLIKA